MPVLSALESFAPALHLIAVFVFAVSGALAAAGKKQTFVTFAFFALVTGVGGGTVRDLMIGAPVFWMRDSMVPLTCLIAALLVWMTPRHIWKPTAVDWFDAVGMAAYSVFGTTKALSFGIGPVPAILMGVLTATAGGIIRDTLAGEPSIVLGSEIYISASALAGGLFVILLMAGAGLPLAAAAGFSAGFALRAGALARGWSLPSYHGGPDHRDDKAD